MIKSYSILLYEITNGSTTFHYTLNGTGDLKNITLTVYNNFLDYIEYQSSLKLEPNIMYWSYVPFNSKNRYVEFKDADTNEVVGMFGLGGLIDYNDIPQSTYIKSLVSNLHINGKKDLHYILNEIFYEKIYNNDFVCVEKDDVVVDIGFNCGLFAIDALEYQPKVIYGYEPNKKLVDNFEQLGIKNIIVNNSAVSNESGIAPFYENEYAGMSSMYSDINSATTLRTYDVSVLKFNSLFADTIIDYLKIDCEGGEYAIFESMSNEYLSNNIRKIALEFHHNINDEKVKNLIYKIEGCGFQTKILYKEGDTTGMLYAKKIKL
jgi:FkbM family methyltransferase